MNRQLEKDPRLPERYGATWRTDWVANIQARFAYLAQAVAVRQPPLFAEMMCWMAASHAASGSTLNDLVASVECMRDVIAEELPGSASAVVASFVDEAIDRLRAPLTLATGIQTDAPKGSYVLRYLDALLSGRRAEAIQIVLEQVRSGTLIAEVYNDVLQPAMHEIGRMWHRSEITVADEHFATATTQTVMAGLRAYAPPPKRSETGIVLTAVSGDFHDLGLRMVADLFEMDGWQVSYLGPNMPTNDLVEFLTASDARLLVLSVATSLHVRTAGELIDAIRDRVSRERLRIIVGGDPFHLAPGLWQELGADAHSADLVGCLSVATRLFS